LEFELWNKVNILPIAHPQLNQPCGTHLELDESLRKIQQTRFLKAQCGEVDKKRKERIAELGREWWRKTCQRSHKFALGYQEVDAMIVMMPSV
jgi:hypothetical protein